MSALHAATHGEYNTRHKMGLLDEALSYIDNKKRVIGKNVQGLLNTPTDTLSQWQAQTKEDIAPTTQALQSWKPGDPQSTQAAVQAMAPLGLLGMTAYHGSPHLFDKFDMSKIGTGEGAQAYGHGLYFAENPNVAGSYKNILGGREFEVNGQKIYTSGGGSTRALDQQTRGQTIAAEALDSAFNAQSTSPAQFAANQLRKQAKQYPEDAKHIDEAMNIIADWQQSGASQKLMGNLYKVDIPDEHVAKMLDWDKPLSEQPQSVRDALRAAGLKNADSSVMRGSGAYGMLSSKLRPEGTDNTVRDSVAAAKALKELGIPGIRYLDGGSRGKGGTSNFVVFDDAIPKIVGRE